jgi:hypothetical protein
MHDLIARGSLSDEFITTTVWHDEANENVRRTPLKRTEFTHSRLRELAAERPDCTLAISSRVWLQSGDPGHLPLMDFQCPAGDPAYLSVVVRALRAIEETDGVVVNSGNSYHYYGFRVLRPDRWYRFLGKCLLLTSLTDTRYIGHRLIDRECVLRVSSDLTRPDPKVVAVL